MTRDLFSTRGLTRVRTAGGVFTGQQISRKGDRVTLMTDEGYRITLTSDDVEPVTAKTSKSVGISGRRIDCPPELGNRLIKLPIAEVPQRPATVGTRSGHHVSHNKKLP